MSINFPNAPIVGQVYPTPALPGVPQYMWDGQAWNGATAYSPERDDNLALNGGAEISQEVGTTATSKTLGSWQYAIDQWNLFAAGSGTFAWQQMSLPVTSVMGARGFRNALRIYCGTAFTMAGASDLADVAQPIEGTRWARLGYGSATAQSVTIGFWVYATIAGTMSVGIKNAAANRCYVTSVVINAALTWEYKTVTIPGDTTGTWAVDNTSGGNVFFSFGAGSGYQGAPNVWGTNAQLWAHTGVTNFFAGTNNEVWMTGLTVVPGSIGPTAAQSVAMLRQYQDDLNLCKRHWQRLNLQLWGGYTSAAGVPIYFTMFFLEMRATPTAAVVTAGGLVNATVAIGSGQITSSSIRFDISLSAVGTGYVQSAVYSLNSRM